MQETEVNGRWQAEMAEFFEGIGDAELKLGLIREGSPDLVEPKLFAEADKTGS